MPGDKAGLNGDGACDSIIRIELITHFHRNPCMEGTPEEVSEAIGRDRARVEAQLKKLVQLRILQEKTRGGELYYRYLPPLAVVDAGREERLPVEAGETATG